MSKEVKENNSEKNQELKTSEKIFYQDESVKVTQSRFTVENETYAMRNISSVTNYEIKKSKIIPRIIMLIGIFLIFLMEAFFIGGMMAIVGLVWQLLLLKNDFAVKISTNAGEPNTLISKNKEYIQEVVDAINEAIIYRG